jgi:hypothetical protein
MTEPTWTISREGEPHASAVAGVGATLQQLADLIALDIGEVSRWSRLETGTPTEPAVAALPGGGGRMTPSTPGCDCAFPIRSS